MRQLCTFFFAVTLFIAKTNCSTAQVNVKDSLALVDLYNSTDGAHWINNLGWLQGPISNWKGVFTSNGRVIEINLQNNNLTGKLPTSIGKLTQLGSLNLESNQIADTIPNSIGNLLNLIFFDLGINTLSGTIPSSLGKLVNLQTLNFASNQLSSSIPSSIGKLTKLNFLELSNNQLSGSLPSSLGNLTQLGWLNLGSNHLSGPIPSSLGKLINLTILYLDDNQFSGPIPSSLGNLVNLTGLGLSNNPFLTGTVPASIGNLINLNNIAMSYTSLTGSVTFLNELPKLYGIWLNNSKFSGTIPSLNNNTSNFLDIELGYNQFTGTLPNFPHPEKITELYLDHNQLTGSIPQSYSNFSPQSSIWINDNQLSGPIPVSFTQLDQYIIFQMQNNHFTFDSLEYIIANSTHQYFTYSPQLNIPVKYTPQGAFGKLSVHAGGTLSNNTYQWYKNNVLYKTVVGDSTFTPDGEGVYFVKVNNSVVTDLQLVSDNITIATACSSAPVNTATNNITSTSAKLTWSASQGAIKYTVQFKPLSAATFTNKSTATTAINLTGLLSNTQYAWKVKAICSLKSSAFTALNNFTTLPALTGGSSSGAEIQQQTDFNFYPNPATKNVNVFLNASKQTSYSISIYDLQGRKLITQAGAASAGDNNFTLDVHALSQGTYFVKINYDNKTVVRKLMKE